MALGKRRERKRRWLCGEQGGTSWETKLKLLQPRSLQQDAPFLALSEPCKSLSRTPTAMASSPCPPSPLLARLQESIPSAHRKLEKYFQSRASGGGECCVQPVGSSAPNTFEVKFLDPADKERVLKKEEHQMSIGDKSVTIFLETIKKPVENSRPSSPSLTQPSDETPSSRPPSLTQSSDEKPSSRPPSLTESPVEALPDEGPVSNSDDSIVQKVFLAVTAELNCELLSKEQRARIATVCPGVRSVEGDDGVAKVCGNFKDIEKIHHFLSVELLESEQKQKYSPQKYPASNVKKDPPNQQDWVRGFSSSEPKARLEDGFKSSFNVSVLFLDYFRHAYPGRIESIEKNFRVKIETRDIDPNMVSVGFIPSQSGNVEAACETLIRDIQKYTQALKQDCVSLENPQRAKELTQELNRCFPKLLIREEERTLTLLGSQADISAATEKVSQMSFQTPVKIMASGYTTGVEVDSTHFKLLHPELLQEISEIEQKYNTACKVQEKGQKTCILFDPKDKKVDLSVHSYTSFTDAVQHAMCQLRTEVLLLKQLGKEKAYLHKTKFVDNFKKKHPNVHFELTQESVTLIGFPNQLAQAKHYIFKKIGLPPSSGEKANMDHETPMDVDRSDSNEDKNDDDCCAICMDTITNKRVLSKCKHEFCTVCITKALSFKPVCPVCQTSYGIQKGNQPEGTMTFNTLRNSLPGYEGCGTIVIQYDMKGGVQTNEHPNPGILYYGTRRTAYLPDNKEGRKVLDLLREAFNKRLIFTIGYSRARGASNVITWNDIHHKTSMIGGPTNFGYPDPDYLNRVKEELKAKGIE